MKYYLLFMLLAVSCGKKRETRQEVAPPPDVEVGGGCYYAAQMQGKSVNICMMGITVPTEVSRDYCMNHLKGIDFEEYVCNLPMVAKCVNRSKGVVTALYDSAFEDIFVAQCKTDGGIPVTKSAS